MPLVECKFGNARHQLVSGSVALVLCASLSSCLNIGLEKRAASNGDTTHSLMSDTTPPGSAQQDVPYSFSPSGVASGVSFFISNPPAWASFDSASGTLSGTPDLAGTYNNISITARLGADQQTIGPFSITVAGDPLLPQAWDYENTGQMTYSLVAGVPGMDAKIRAANRLGYFGRGVRVVVSDSGVEIAHEDLAANVASGSRNYALSPPYTGTPAPFSSPVDEDQDAHGTGVAGVIAGVGWNGLGNRGVAPLANLVGFNFISYTGTNFTAHLLDQIDDPQAAVFNQSWGTTGDAYTSMDPSYLAAIVSTVTGNRGGKGAILVRAAGNEFLHKAPDAHLTYYVPLPCTIDSFNAPPYDIVVGAFNSQGLAASYSSPGSCLWIAAPGGEFGYNIGLGTDVHASAATLAPDLSGCTHGTSRSDSTQSVFQSGGNDNSGCNYTMLFNGTSSATPHVAGTVALMLEANPNLTWRDVKHILAKTATKIDPTSGDTLDASDPSGHINLPAWRTNAAGYHFHSRYGFGGLDALAAVQKALTFTANSLGTFQQTSWLDSGTTDLNASIPDDNGSGVNKQLTSSDNLTIEAVQISVIVTHPYVGNVGIELVSPQGTRSVIVNTNNGMGDTANLGNPSLISNPDPTVGGAVMLSNSFYGENTNGTWTLNVIDGYGYDAGYAQYFTGKLNRWAIKFYGHTPLTPEP